MARKGQLLASISIGQRHLQPTCICGALCVSVSVHEGGSCASMQYPLTSSPPHLLHFAASRRDRLAACRSLLQKYRHGNARLYLGDGTSFEQGAPPRRARAEETRQQRDQACGSDSRREQEQRKGQESAVGDGLELGGQLACKQAKSLCSCSVEHSSSKAHAQANHASKLATGGGPHTRDKRMDEEQHASGGETRESKMRRRQEQLEARRSRWREKQSLSKKDRQHLVNGMFFCSQELLHRYGLDNPASDNQQRLYDKVSRVCVCVCVCLCVCVCVCVCVCLCVSVPVGCTKGFALIWRWLVA